MKRILLAEFLGTAILLAGVIGSGIMGDRLAAGNDAIALLANAIATGGVLVVIITIFAPVSGAHFNPVVSFIFYLRAELTLKMLAGYICAQISGGLVGMWLSHAMFELPLWQISQTSRDGGAQFLSELIATFGLILTILGALRANAPSLPMLVGLYITAAYWFTASTSFANPAVSIARGFTNTFAGIAPDGIAMFIVAQFIGAIGAFMLAKRVFD